MTTDNPFLKLKQLLGSKTEFRVHFEFLQEDDDKDDITVKVLSWLKDPPVVFKDDAYLKCCKMKMDMYKKWDIYHIIQDELTEHFLRIEDIKIEEKGIVIHFINYPSSLDDL